MAWSSYDVKKNLQERKRDSCGRYRVGFNYLVERSGVLAGEIRFNSICVAEPGAGPSALRFGKWKAIRSPMSTGEIELYDLSNDFQEKRTYAARRPDLTRHATKLLDETHRPDPNWQVTPPKPKAGASAVPSPATAPAK